MNPPGTGDDWVALTAEALPSDAAAAWVVLPRCGAVVSFAGTARDHSTGPDGAREGVTELVYEAYEGPALARMAAILTDARRQWPEVGRLVALHRLGEVPLGEAAVVVVASAPHRGEAFAAARFVIDTLKASVPIWKQERWAGGSDWAGDARPVRELSPSAGDGR